MTTLEFVRSVYLKQAGPITLLASAGSYVPADRATTSTLDRIFSAMTIVDSLCDARGASALAP